jgi:hypothetical protein
MAGVPPHLRNQVGTIGYYNDSPPDGTYEVLGIVKGQYNRLDSFKQIEWNLKLKAYLYYGSNAHAIIRVSSTMVQGYRFPLREVQGTVIKYKKK